MRAAADHVVRLKLSEGVEAPATRVWYMRIPLDCWRWSRRCRAERMRLLFCTRTVCRLEPLKANLQETQQPIFTL